MKQNMKMQYMAPTTEVVVMDLENTICIGSGEKAPISWLWMLDGSTMDSQDYGWERDGYTGGSF